MDKIITYNDAEQLLKTIEESDLFAFNLPFKNQKRSITVRYSSSKNCYIAELLTNSVFSNQIKIFGKSDCIDFLYNHKEDINKEMFLFPKSL